MKSYIYLDSLDELIKGSMHFSQLHPETIEQRQAQIGVQGKLGARSFCSAIYSPSGSCRDNSFML